MSIPMNYRTSYKWTGDASLGSLDITGHDSLVVGAPGDQGSFSPEHLLLAAAEICLANTLFAISNRSKLEIKAYRSTAEGELEFIPKEGFRFKRIAIRPVLTVAEGAESRAELLLNKAHSACLVSRSLSFPVEIDADIRTA